MTPARSVAASVVALGFASALTAPVPASANPAPCQRIEHYAAQAGAQILRVNRLDLGPLAVPGNRRGAADQPEDGPSAEAPKRSAGPRSGPAGGAGGPAKEGGDEGEARNGAGSNRPAPSGAGAVEPQEPERRGGLLGSTLLSGNGGSGNDGSGNSGSGNGGSGAAMRPVALTGDDGSGAATKPVALKPAAVAAQRQAGTPAAGRAGAAARAPEGTGQSISGVGVGDSRTVLIADGPVNSAGAARVLDGRVAGAPATDDLVVQQAPPSNAKPTVRNTGEKRFGPLRAGGGKLTAHARWDDGVRCGTTEASSSAAELDRITLTGMGNGSLIRVPEKITGLSRTGLKQSDGQALSVADATVTAGRISLADGEVRIRVLRAPALRVSMSATGEGRVDYRPAVVEVSGKGIPTKRLETVRDHVDVTLRNEAQTVGSVPALIKPIGPLPLPPVPGLPAPGMPETTPAPAGNGGTKLRISLGDVRQAAKDKAVAARADAIKISVVRDAERGHGRTGDNRVKPGYGPSALVADLSVGLLEGAAVAPGTGQGVSSAGAGAGGGVGSAGLPITGPRTLSLALGGVALLLGGIGVVVLTSRRRRLTQ